MNCPCCTHTLRTIEYEGVEIETCDGCGGEFVSGEEIGHIVRVREQRFGPSDRAGVAGLGPVFGIADTDATTRFICPRCAKPMNPINYAGDTGVVVDRCPSCEGLWLENSELEKIQVLLERWQDEAPGRIAGIAGELDRSRSEALAGVSQAFRGSRFSFVNAVINRLLEAA
ncbi:MAG: zf-TFIIB domain-containing protein [Phycisphaeraceae bacterium]|nr:zf-TFIIB domain-containing protein [Phycisphaerae bacterium]MBX3393550.1 zf-TFIIB domain-containing protein [Phycisphaeraceae bacterium]